MAIRRKRSKRETPSDELPPAKLFLDDVEDIVAILTSSAGGAPCHSSVSYSVGDATCDTIEDLQQMGGRTTKFKIIVTQVPGEVGIPSAALPLRSRLTVSWADTTLWLESASGDEFWVKRGKIGEIFESNSIWWRRAIQTIFQRIPYWLYFGVIFAGIFLSPGHFSWSEYVRARGWWLEGAVLFLAMYVCLFRHSVVVLRRRHEGGISKWLREHATQIIFLILAALLGAIAKSIIEHVWPGH